MKNNITVAVGLSGGVDSSVSALLLKEQGYQVIGLFMKNWEEKDDNGLCRSAEDYQDVVRVCDQLKIPHYSLNFSKDYWDLVFSRFIADFEAGFTPNPDILCNKEIKFNLFFQKATQELGADYLATGHYCQNPLIQGKPALVKGADPQKDQSYFLYTIKKETLQKVLFPVGGLLKSEVRKIAADHQLATAEKKDSTGICFIGKRDFKEFLGQYIASTPGNFENSRGEILGKHDGLAFYTIGQRKGIGRGGPGEAWYVVDKDKKRNVVIIEQGEHPTLFRQSLTATEISWVDEMPSLPFRCHAKIRYRQPDVPCTIFPHEGDTLLVEFDTPQKAVTPRQSIVFYDQDICLGGGIIQP